MRDRVRWYSPCCYPHGESSLLLRPEHHDGAIARQQESAEQCLAPFANLGEGRHTDAGENLTAEVEGDINDVDGVLRITAIRLHYHLRAPAEMRDKIDRLLETYSSKCPAYQSVKGCIDVTWDAEIVDTE